MLDLTIDQTAFDALPERLQEEYKKDGEDFRLTVPTGLVPKAKVDEFRKTNIAQKKKLEAFGDMDPTEAQDALDRREEFEASDGANTPEKIREAAEKLAAERIMKITATHEGQLRALKSERDGLRSSLQDRVIGDALRKEGTSQGLLPSAIDDLIARGRGTFQVGDDGSLIALESDGETPRLNDRGDGYGANDFVVGLVKTAPHLFGESKGSDTKGSSTTSAASVTGSNPWDPKTFNLTKQGDILKGDPKLAQRLAAKVGKVISIGGQ
jgi:hypothetical protein